jgi:hypothetical protein
MAYRSLGDKPFGSKYFYVDTVLDHPVERIWPHVVNISSWMTDHTLETLNGQTGSEGHFERVWAGDIDRETTPEPHYHYYGVSAVVPHKLLALEVFPEEGGSYGSMKDSVGFDAMLFTDLGDGRTKLSFLMIEVEPPEEGDKAAQEWQDLHEVLTERISRYFDNLRELVQSA